jgi:hypothetical protein
MVLRCKTPGPVADALNETRRLQRSESAACIDQSSLLTQLELEVMHISADTYAQYLALPRIRSERRHFCKFFSCLDFCSTPYSEAVQKRGSALRGPKEAPVALGPLLLPSLCLRLQAVDAEGSETDLYTSEAAQPSLNCTWPLPETLWVDTPACCSLQDCTALQVHVQLAESGERVLSLLLQLEDLVPLHVGLHSMPPLPLNSILLELCSGELYAVRKPSAASAASEFDETPTAANSSTSSSSSDSSPPAPPPLSPFFTPNISDHASGDSYDAEELEALTQLRSEVLQLEASAAEQHTAVAAAFGSARPAHQQALAAAQRTERLRSLRQQLRAEAALLAQEEQQSCCERAALAAETEQLREAAAAVTTGQAAVAAAQQLLLGERGQLAAAAALVRARELRLAAGLRAVYPIRYSAQAGAYTIWDVPVDLLGRDDELVSAALGHAAHLTCMLAKVSPLLCIVVLRLVVQKRNAVCRS